MSSTKRHTYRPGDAIGPGATYYPMDGARQIDPLEPDDVIAALDAYNESEEHGWCGADPNEARGEMAFKVTPTMQPIGATAEHWSPWLEWRGGPCPLPGGTRVNFECRDEFVGGGEASRLAWDHPKNRLRIVRFRYLADNPAGWLPRGDWIPPAELWAPECPVRCEWAMGMHTAAHPGTAYAGGAWSDITHIRLVARQPQAGLPEGWSINEDGNLADPRGVIFEARQSASNRYDHPVILQAVDAWLREMGDE